MPLSFGTNLSQMKTNDSYHLTCDFGASNTKSPANAGKMVAVIKVLLLTAILNPSDEYLPVYKESQFLPHQKTT